MKAVAGLYNRTTASAAGRLGMLSSIWICLLLSVSAGATVVGSAGLQSTSERVFPAVDGMLIRGHPKFLQQLRIRAKSLGPGVCATRVGFVDSVIDIAAPPLTWSDWYAIGPAFQGTTESLKFAPQCDTGSIG